jgi:hypothetical protein
VTIAGHISDALDFRDPKGVPLAVTRRGAAKKVTTMAYRVILISFLILWGGGQPLLADTNTQAAQSSTGKQVFVPGELVVRTHPEAPADEIKSLLLANGGTILQMNSAHGFYRVLAEDSPEKTAFSIQLRPSVLSARPNYVLAKFDGGSVTLYDLELMVERMIPAGRARFVEPKPRQELLSQVFYDKLFAKAGKDENLLDDPGVQMQIEEAVERTLARIYRARIDGPAITPQELAEYYEQNVEQFGAGGQIKGRSITVKTREEAKEILRLLEAGGDFATLAKERSTDSNSERGGTFSWVGRDKLPAPVAEKIFSLEVGQVSEIMEIPTGYFLIKVEDKRASERRPLSDVESLVRAKLERTRRKEALELRKKELLERYVGELHPEFLDAMNVNVTQEELTASLPKLNVILNSAIETPYE